jgi:hypothetical protein
MKRTIISFALVSAILGFVILTMVPKAQPVSAAAAMAAPIPAALAVPLPPKCPNIHHAIEALQNAMHDMEKADHDFCGHKRDAMEATRNALEQLRRAEDCDQCRK